MIVHDVPSYFKVIYYSSIIGDMAIRITAIISSYNKWGYVSIFLLSFVLVPCDFIAGLSPIKWVTLTINELVLRTFTKALQSRKTMESCIPSS